MTDRYMSDRETRRFKSLMIAKGFESVSGLARAMGIRRETLSRKINGLEDWSRAEMEAVARLFGEDPNTVFFSE